MNSRLEKVVTAMLSSLVSIYHNHQALDHRATWRDLRVVKVLIEIGATIKVLNRGERAVIAPIRKNKKQK